jgi:raffinose/stachyose/melibiose transport system substrate-binding protein
MRMRRRALGVAAACCAALLVVAGCSSSSSSSSTDNGKITLNLWAWSGAPNAASLQRAVAGYEAAHPNITVKINQIASDDFKAKVPLALNGGQQIDVLAVQPNLFADQISGKLLPLSSWQKYLPSGTLDKFTPLSIEQNKKLYSDGKVYSVPFAVSGSAVGYYNADILAKLGVQPPQTWDDVVKLAGLLKQKLPGVAPIVMPSGSDSWFQDEFVLTLVGQSDPTFFNNVRYNNGKWDTPSYVAAVTEYQKLYQEGALSKNLLDVNYANAMQLFDTGKAAIVFNGSWESTLLSSSFRQANKINIADVGAMPAPTSGDPSTRSLRSFLDVTLGIPKNSKHVQADASLIAYLTTGDGVNKWAQDLGEIPAVAGWTPPSGVLTTPASQQGFTTIETLLANPHSDRNNLSAFSGQVGTRLLQVANGQDPAKAVSAMQADLDSGKYN